MRTIQAGASVVQDVSFHPSGGELAIVLSGRTSEQGNSEEPAVVWFDPATWTESRRLSLFDAVRPGVLWTQETDGDVRVTDMRAAFPGGPTAFALSPDHTKIVSAWPCMISYKWQQIAFSDVLAGTASGPVTGPRDTYAEWMSYSPGGQWIVYRADGYFDFLGKKYIFFLEDTPTVALTADAETLAYANPAGLVRFWDTRQFVAGGHHDLPADLAEPGLAHDSPVRQLRFSASGGLLAVGTESGVSIWQMPTRQIVQHFSTANPILHLAFSKDESRLAATEASGGVRVWGLAPARPLQVFDWQVGELGAVAFAPDGLTCAAGGGEGQVVVWDVDV